MGTRLVPEGNCGDDKDVPQGEARRGRGAVPGELSVRLWGLGCLRVAAQGVGKCLSPNMGAAEMSGQGFYSARGGSACPAGEEMLGRVVQACCLPIS